MKCKHCDGDGVIVDVEYGHAGKYGCKYCDGKGVVEPLTNEEWFDTLSTTEEKAEAIFECVMANSWIFNKDGIKRWLKQPHKEG